MADKGSQLLEELLRFKPEGLTANAWAVQAGVGRTIWSDLRRHGNPSRRTLEKLLAEPGSSPAEFGALGVVPPSEGAAMVEALAEPGQAWRQAPARPLPLVKAEQRGAWGDPNHGIPRIAIAGGMVADWLPRPASLAADRKAYAIAVPGESMWPRFRAGRPVAVSPAARVEVGDDVLLTLAGGQGALIGELLLRTQNGATLRQFNPPIDFEIPAADIAEAHKVVGELI